ncbi:Protein of unknown function [Bacillus wiedmannii]|nr:Protein of unknown function [Bacillus wiedmannii]
MTDSNTKILVGGVKI